MTDAGTAGDRAETEAVVGAIFDEVLGAGPADTDADFFLRGGHSLLALAALEAIEERLGVCVELGDFFANATVQKLARLIMKLRVDAVAAPQSAQRSDIRGAGDPAVLLRLLDASPGQEEG